MIVPSKKKTRVAAYVRVSSEKEAALNSIENQTLAYAELIARNPHWELVGIYEDIGISGTLECRPQFQRMLEDCRSGKIDLIITKSYTRFARNTVVLLNTLRELKELNVNVRFENDNIDSFSQNGELLISLLGAYAQAESFSASENQRWRIKKMFESGLLPCGKRLGYKLKAGRLIIIPEEAEIIKSIYSDYVSGMGYIAIAKKLTNQEIKNPKGDCWKKSYIRSILQNEKYAGWMLLNKSYRKDYISKIHIRNKGERNFYLVKNSHESIIDEELASIANLEKKRRAERFKPRRQRKRNHLFTSLITCEHCGRHYHRKIASSGKKYKKPVWVCGTMNVWGQEYCPSQQIPEKILEEKTARVLSVEKLNREVLKNIKEIRVPGRGRLIYIWKNGKEVEVSWQNPSRRDSWTEEMRETARQHTLARLGKTRRHNGKTNR